ncbi:VOC family protein [Epidermidibacterium keratini]|uniref:VOC family protein n=1 Tax=Epidermidibacterium keratini TaxID=1891644 RepID=A0A7L4YLJ2_9ACTN|nr:VOC family protein [Epidermidibacterium keratini]QHB99999.1 VOC family protein [Epidermidibacterium keratini]
MDIRWITAFLDFEPAAHERATAFWSAVTGYAVSEPRGEHAEFATLIPPNGDAYLRVQRQEEGPSRIHLDLHVDDVRRHADRAISLGATELVACDYVTLRSPGGLEFCFVTHPGESAPPMTQWDGGLASAASQLCIDVPASRWDAERDFWGGVLGVPIEYAGGSYAQTPPSADRPMHLVLQRLDDDPPTVGAHLDFETNARDDEAARHQELGATVLDTGPEWTVLRDPAGLPYCICGPDCR